MESARLAGDLRVDVAHEGGQLLDALGPEQEVAVVGEVDEVADPHAVALLEPGQDADHQVAETGAGPEQEAALNDPAGHLHQAVVVGQVAELVSHALRDGIGDDELPLIE